MMRTRIGRFCLSASLLLACDDNDEIAAEDTSTAFQYIGGLARDAATVAQEEHVDAPGTTAPVDTTIECRNGGSVTISGTTATCADTAERGTYRLQVTADDCSADGVRIDGTFEHSASADEMGRLIYTIEGEVRLGGPVEGPCAVDVAYEFPEDGGYSLSGSLCDHDTESLEIMAGLLPPWRCPEADAPGS